MRDIKKREIIIERIFDAPRKLVWKAWTDPEMVKKWWGPKGFTAPSIKIDLKVGAKYIYCMHGPKGSEFDNDLYSAGIYKEIVPMEKLVVIDYFSDENGEKIDPSIIGMNSDMPDEMNVVTRFEEVENGKTRLTIEYPKPGSEVQFEAMQKSRMVEGWNSSLDKLADLLGGKEEKFMSNSSKPNIGAAMVLIHHAINRGLEVSRKQSVTFELSGFTDQAIKEGFVTYVRTLVLVINAHHQTEDHVIFPYLRHKLPDAPYDQLSIEHQEMDVFLNELQATIEEIKIKVKNSDLLNSLKHSLTGLIELWTPHIEKEQFYLYDTSKTEAVMDVNEQIKLIQDASEYSQKQGDPAFIMPFILYNLEPEERANISHNMPPVLIQELVPKTWRKQWSPMQPFLLN